MANTYTFKQIQDTILRRTARINTKNAASTRDMVKDIINEVYFDILSRRKWNFLFISENVQFDPSIFDALLQNYFRVIRSVFTLISPSKPRSLDPISKEEFDRFIRGDSTIQSTYPRYYLLLGQSTFVGSEETEEEEAVPSTFGRQNFRIWPPSSQDPLTVTVDGEYWPQFLSNDNDQPALSPLLQIALIRGSLSHLLEFDEDARADSYLLKFESDIEKAQNEDEDQPDNYQSVVEPYQSYQDVDGSPQPYPWEV